MGKISQVSSKYIIHSKIEIEGVVDRPDVIGAVFGQTEGLLGSDLELRELQRSGRIGRIEVNLETKNGKTIGTIIIPSSLDKAETSIIGASLEIIQRIGPCNAKIKVSNIEDVRISKRQFVIERAKELLKTMMDGVMPDSTELADEVANSVRVMEIQDYGREKLPAGPLVDESDEVIVVEGRADVLNLLKHGFKNIIAMNGTSCPNTILELSKKKEIIVFVDGDRGGNLIIRDVLNQADIDFVTKAPDGKEVEELTKKEIHKALRSKMTAEQAKMELSSHDTSQSIRKSNFRKDKYDNKYKHNHDKRYEKNDRNDRSKPKNELNSDEKTKFKKMVEDLVGTRGAYILDNKLSILGKVPLTELEGALKSMSGGVYAVILDGEVDKNMVQLAERIRIKHIIGMSNKVKNAKVNILTQNDF